MRTVKSKTVYGGMLVDKYYLILSDGQDIQVHDENWKKYKKGDVYPKESVDKKGK